MRYRNASSTTALDPLPVCDLSFPMSLLCTVFSTRYAAPSIAAVLFPVFPRLQNMLASIPRFGAGRH
ncbi:hypothetical protein ABIE33_002778 [Ensifer sp. 4252]